MAALRNSGRVKAATDDQDRRSAPAVGEVLRQTRLSLGQTLADVARDVRIRQTFLEAIEGGDYQELPGPAYTLGFIRTYAEHLGLDGTEIVRRFKAESGQTSPKSRLNFPSPTSESAAPKAAVLLIGGLIALAAYGIWYLSANRYLDVAELVVPLPEHLRHMLPGEDHGVVAAVPPAAPSPTPTEAANTPTNETASAPSKPLAPNATTMAPERQPPAEVSTAAAPPPTAPSPAALPPAPSPATATSPAAAPAATTPTAATSETGGRILLKVTADSWVEIREAGTRNALVARLLRAGETFAVPDRPGLTLMTGNAGGIEVSVDGQVLPPLGKPGSVRRNVPLVPDQLKATAAN